ncbi:uncharacterized protein LOC133311441 [Gastrolobium bilobum]|uniref:uncharacterized protein LOC133311441 n=1 Tax=Gastrolobium bilobum TaxID=150636 RepID=UPI002AB2FBC0|nr:uncharacterized protein LOC133311441 [Gastrolobium bilobum]
MENKAKLIKGGTNAREGVYPTRLKKHAPASLEIDKVLSGRPDNPFAPSVEASNAIPLLSPLFLSPQTLYSETTIHARTSENSGNNGSISNEGRSSSSTPINNGWKHPAMAPCPEPSSLCSILQKQCVLVNNTQ